MSCRAHSTRVRSFTSRGYFSCTSAACEGRSGTISQSDSPTSSSSVRGVSDGIEPFWMRKSVRTSSMNRRASAMSRAATEKSTPTRNISTGSSDPATCGSTICCPPWCPGWRLHGAGAPTFQVRPTRAQNGAAGQSSFMVASFRSVLNGRLRCARSGPAATRSAADTTGRVRSRRPGSRPALRPRSSCPTRRTVLSPGRPAGSVA